MKAGVSIQRIETFVAPRIGLIYEIHLDKYLAEEYFNAIYVFLVNKHSYFPIQIRNVEPVIRLIPIKRNNTSSVIKKLLILLTVLTVFLTGYGLTESFYKFLDIENSFVILTWSIVYTFLFLIALGFHEYGHLKVSRRDGIVVDGPFFIPAPPIQLGFIGTLGAVITMRNIPPNRNSLARIGLSGPLISFTIGLFIGIFGLLISPHVRVERVAELEEISFLPLVLQLMLLFIKVEEGYTILAHPLLIASFIILLVTFLNLIPIGQLDGGHVVRSYVSERIYENLSYVIIVTTLLAGIILFIFNKPAYMYYVFLTFILTVFKIIFGRKPHPGPANQVSHIKTYKYMYIYLLLLTLTTPIPI